MAASFTLSLSLLLKKTGTFRSLLIIKIRDSTTHVLSDSQMLSMAYIGQSSDRIFG